MHRLAIAALSLGCSTPHAPGSTPAVSVAGTWRGTSLCTVKPSACHDETVVYHVSAEGDHVTIVANKVVDGREEEMGTVHCQLAHDVLSCPIEKGTFTFTLDGTRMHGTLALTDGTRFRTIEVERAP